VTYHFKPGDYIRVARIAGSSWQDRHGTIVDVIVRYQDGPVQECSVSFDGERRWFMARHLIRTISPKLIRFFRNEALDRWKLDPDKSASLNGDFDQLMDLLCDHCDFPLRRAQTEVEQFYEEFERKAQQITGIETYAAIAPETPRGRRTNNGLTESPTAA
jgi:hypothetical protein